jgi:hypothetical protein
MVRLLNGRLANASSSSAFLSITPLNAGVGKQRRGTAQRKISCPAAGGGIKIRVPTEVLFRRVAFGEPAVKRNPAPRQCPYRFVQFAGGASPNDESSKIATNRFVDNTKKFV